MISSEEKNKTESFLMEFPLAGLLRGTVFKSRGEKKVVCQGPFLHRSARFLSDFGRF